MRGKINYGTGGLTHVETEADLPGVGSEAIIYYIEDEDTFVIWSSGWVKFKTRRGTYLLNQDLKLAEQSQENCIVDMDKLIAIDSFSDKPSIGDEVFDIYGASGYITNIEAREATIRIFQANLEKRIKYNDQSWDMWLTDELTGGHYSWDSSSEILRYEGFNRDRTSPVIYETYAIKGGGPDFYIDSENPVGTRFILSWSGESKGEGDPRFYYTKEKDNNDVTSNDEISTIGDVYSILHAESGIYIGVAQTEHELNEGNIEGALPGHELSENDWAYVMHYAPNVVQYSEGTINTRYEVGTIIEYNSALYKVEKAFTKTNWANDVTNCFAINGSRYSFIYRTDKVTGEPQWILGMEIEQDFPFPDDTRLTTNSHNQMTIKANGVDTVSIADSAVTTPKLADKSVNNDKIADATIQADKLDISIQESLTKAETCWYSGNFVVSRNQPTPPDTDYIIWIDADTSLL